MAPIRTSPTSCSSRWPTAGAPLDGRETLAQLEKRGHWQFPLTGSASSWLLPNLPTTIVNDTSLGGAQTNVQTTHLANGGFVVAWTTNLGGQLDVMFQRYDASGNQIGSATAANSTVAGDQTLTDIIANSNGTFTLAWTAGNTVTTRSFNGSTGVASSTKSIRW